MEWISITNHLPSNGQRVICYNGKYIEIKQFENLESSYIFYDGHYHWTAHHIGLIENVTHWMPLPELPKE